jgi:hypothetical protein
MILLCFISFFIGFGFCQSTLQFKASASTYIDRSQPNTNFGTSSSLAFNYNQVQQTYCYPCSLSIYSCCDLPVEIYEMTWIYLTFNNLSLGANQCITSAVLSLTYEAGDDLSAPGVFVVVREVASNWQQNTLTYSLKQNYSYNSEVPQQAFVTDGVTYNLTIPPAIIQPYLSGSVSFQLELEAGGNDYSTTFYSKVSSTGKPVLTLQYSTCSCLSYQQGSGCSASNDQIIFYDYDRFTHRTNNNINRQTNSERLLQ